MLTRSRYRKRTHAYLEQCHERCKVLWSTSPIQHVETTLCTNVQCRWTTSRRTTTSRTHCGMSSGSLPSVVGTYGSQCIPSYTQTNIQRDRCLRHNMRITVCICTNEDTPRRMWLVSLAHQSFNGSHTFLNAAITKQIWRCDVADDANHDRHVDDGVVGIDSYTDSCKCTHEHIGIVAHNKHTLCSEEHVQLLAKQISALLNQTRKSQDRRSKTSFTGESAAATFGNSHYTY